MTEDGSRGRTRADSSASRIPLADAAPNLAAYLPADERFVLDQISVPVVHVSNGSLSVPELLERRGAFAAIVLDGLVLHELAIAGAPGLWILGPGDVIAAVEGWGPSISSYSRLRVRASARLALLGSAFLAAVGRAPRVIVGLQAAAAEQMERLATQLVICQMPRVADRVQAMLWLLAETFGRVTPAGTRLPLSLTHEVIGTLVGARRPTVTLALGELAKRGAVVQQDAGWLLLEPVARAAAADEQPLEEPKLLEQGPTKWAASPPSVDAGIRLEALQDTVSRLREEHRQQVRQVSDRLSRARTSRERSSEVLRSIRAERGLSGQPPA